MSIVICELPKAGLGNQLFPLVKAAVFAHLNELPLVVTGYNQFKLGPYLRREKVKRKYKGYFRFQKSLLGEQMDRLFLIKYKGCESIAEPPVCRLAPEERKAKKFIFSAIPHWSDYFAGLKEHRDLAISLLSDMLDEKVKQALNRLDAPCIGVHIRMGDFRKLRAGEDFKSAGAIRTPEYYFIELIEYIRKISNKNLAVSVFTDGYKNEFEKLFTLDNVQMIEDNTDIVDLFLLSKSKLIITSAGSTFSYWSAFLSNAPVIMHPDHLHAPIRPDEVNRRWYEGPIDSVSGENQLTGNIRCI